MTPAETIALFFDGTPFLVKGRIYHTTLPAALTPWYCYTSDGGHSILALLDGVSDEDSELWQQLCPVPVKTVLRGWRLHSDGFVVAEKGFQYNEQIGLVTDKADDEF